MRIISPESLSTTNYTWRAAASAASASWFTTRKNSAVCPTNNPSFVNDTMVATADRLNGNHLLDASGRFVRLGDLTLLACDIGVNSSSARDAHNICEKHL
jgi:hypothetical protein